MARLVRGVGEHAEDAKSAILNAYERGETDEFIVPTVLPEASPMGAGASVIFCNFRNDRPLQLSKALAKEDFHAFERGEGFEPVRLTMMTKYSKEFLGRWCSRRGARTPTSPRSSASSTCTSSTVRKPRSTRT